VVHGDLKPSNIIITPEGDAQNSRFRFWHARSDPAEFDRQTLETIFGGAPLRTRRKRFAIWRLKQIDASPASQSTDLWALGVVLYENGDRLASISWRESLSAFAPRFCVILRGLFRPRCPPGLASIILHCLEKRTCPPVYKARWRGWRARARGLNAIAGRYHPRSFAGASKGTLPSACCRDSASTRRFSACTNSAGQLESSAPPASCLTLCYSESCLRLQVGTLHSRPSMTVLQTLLILA